MADLRHPNVVLYKAQCRDPPCVVTEYCSGGSVYDVLNEAREKPEGAHQLTWARR